MQFNFLRLLKSDSSGYGGMQVVAQGPWNGYSDEMVYWWQKSGIYHLILRHWVLLESSHGLSHKGYTHVYMS